jgi:hypothetical protein
VGWLLTKSPDRIYEYEPSGTGTEMTSSWPALGTTVLVHLHRIREVPASNICLETRFLTKRFVGFLASEDEE